MNYTLTFHRSVSVFVLEVMEKEDIKLECCFCGCDLNSSNLGGIISNKRGICSNVVCLLKRR